MNARFGKCGTQRGAALILMITIMVLGIAWFTVGALGKMAPTRAEREVKTGLALQQAKQALLAHAAQYAARSSTSEPGQLPCPESVNSVGGANEGQASPSCSNSSVTVGRLPWRTLGIDQLRDGHGEPLWYVLSPGFRGAPINFGTVGQLTYNGVPNSAVAVVIAPGSALNTLGSSGSPSGACSGYSKVDQQAATRNTAPLDRANFLECGNAAGNYANPGTSDWTNDRAVAITATELFDAISGAVADRLQRQVLPALWGWDAAELATRGKSWGSTYSLPYLPFASTFGDPTTNSFCGNAASTQRRGLAPIASTSAPGPSPGNCSSDWSGTTSNVVRINNFQCTQTGSELVCSGQRSGNPPLSGRITARADNVANSFRGTISLSDISINYGGTATLSMSIASGSGQARATIDVTWPPGVPGGATVSVTIPNLPDAAVLSDTRLAWFLNNEWYRYAYYEVSRAETVNSVANCTSPGDLDCIQVRGLPTSTGNYWDKRLVFALSGMPLPGHSFPSMDPSDYFEEENGSTGDRIYRADLRVANPSPAPTPYPAFNDHVAACPFYFTDGGGSQVAVCN